MPVKRSMQIRGERALTEEAMIRARMALGAYAGVTAVSLTGSAATIVLTPQQAQNKTIQLTGAVRSGGVTLQFPNGAGAIWHVSYKDVTGLATDDAISLAVGSGVFGSNITGSENSTLAVVVSLGANTAPAVLLGT